MFAGVIVGAVLWRLFFFQVGPLAFLGGMRLFACVCVLRTFISGEKWLSGCK